MKQHKRRRITFISLGIVLALVLGGLITFLVYTSGYARAGIRAVETHTDTTLLIEDNGKYISVQTWGSEADTGFIFYPGGLVDSDAYLPYLAGVARQGYYCAVVEAPFHLAILGVDRAQTVINDNPQITTWVVGGHSLGGVAAATWLERTGGADGIVFLASYPTVDMSASGLPAVSITASNDEVLNWDSWNNARKNLPAGTLFAEIEGGNHAGFGDYGAQDGDGEATIAPEAQQQQAVAHTVAVLAEAAGEPPEVPEMIAGDAA